MSISMIVPYYNQPCMLAEQIRVWRTYSAAVWRQLEIIVVDDGSQRAPAANVFRVLGVTEASLYRIIEDIPWNISGAWNLGATEARADFLFLTAIDHLLTASEMEKLLAVELRSTEFYLFQRRKHYNGEVCNPHHEIHVIAKAEFWGLGGCDEDFAGHLDGQWPYIRARNKALNQILLPVELTVYHQEDGIPDASVRGLPRDSGANRPKIEAKRRAGFPRPSSYLRFHWEKVG